MPAKKGIRNVRGMRGRTRGIEKTPIDDGLDRSDTDGMVSLHDRWLEWMAGHGYTKSAVGTRRQAISEFMRWAEERSLTRAEDIVRAHLEAYQRYLWRRKSRYGKPLAIGTQLQRLGAIRAFFGWLVKQHYLEANPASDLDLPRNPSRQLPRGFSHDEIRRIMSVPDITDPLGIRDRTILELFYACGLRRKELVGLDLGHVDHAGALVAVHNGKGDKERLIPVSQRALGWLDRYLEHSRPRLEFCVGETALFLTGYGERFVLDSISCFVRRIIDIAGIGGWGSCHRFRHACATHMLEGGADLKIIQQMLGHASAGTTAIYTAVDISLLRKVYSVTHPSALK